MGESDNALQGLWNGRY